MPSPVQRLAAVRPLWAIEGGRLDIHGSQLLIDSARPPVVFVGDVPARVVYASSTTIGALVPPGLPRGPTSVRVEGLVGETAIVDVGSVLATGLHQIDNPVFDRDGNVYVTFSGARGEAMPVSIFRVRPDGTRETFVSGIINATSMALGPDGRLFVSSRFEGTVYRVGADGQVDVFASELGVACGLVFGPDGTLYVGDRSGTIFAVSQDGRTRTLATLPASVAAFHLAMGPDGALYVTAPTIGPYDHVYRVDLDGTVESIYAGFGRPQGLAFDAQGALYVVDALAGASGLYRLHEGEAELVLAGPMLVGVAFDPHGGLVVASNETAYRLDVNVRAAG